MSNAVIIIIGIMELLTLKNRAISIAFRGTTRRRRQTIGGDQQEMQLNRNPEAEIPRRQAAFDYF